MYNSAYSSNNQDAKTTWAFAVDPTGRRPREHRPAPHYGWRYIITSCSPTAKAAGVRAGMVMSDARKLVPELRVLVYAK